MDEKTERSMKLLNNAFLSWQRDQIKSGVPASEASQTEFSRVIGVPNTSWSSWSRGTRIPTDPKSLRSLAANPYIGNAIYRALGLPVPVDDKRLRYMNDHWDEIPAEIQTALYDRAKESVPNDDENLVALT